MPVLPLVVEGPMQSWGTQSRFTEREAGIEPSKSGVVGMICTAMGRPRESDVTDLAGLRMGVRVDREGRPARDYQTVMDVPRADGSGSEKTLPSNRYYLSDACFLVLLEGTVEMLMDVSSAFKDPKWLPFLGRKAFPPTSRIDAGLGILDGTIEESVKIVHWLGRSWERNRVSRIRTVIECGPDEGEPRYDVPVSFALRTYMQRFVRTDWIPITDLSEG